MRKPRNLELGFSIFDAEFFSAQEIRKLIKWLPKALAWRIIQDKRNRHKERS